MNVAIWSNIASTRSLRATEWEESAAERVRQRRLPRVRERREQSGHGTHRCRTGGKPTAGCRGSGYRRPHSPPEVQIGSSPCSERARPSACPRQGRLATEGQQAGRQAGRQAAAAKLTHTSSGGGAEEESSSAKSTRGRLILCTVDRGVIGHWALHMHSGNGQPPAANGATNGALLAFGDLIQYCILDLVSFAHFQSDPTAAAVPNSKIQPNKLS